MHFLKRYRLNFIFGILFAFLMILPDLIFDLVQPYIHYNFDPAFVFALIVFGFFLSKSGAVLFCLVMAALLAAQLIQLNHIAYFGQPINPVDISKVFHEFTEIIETGMASLRDVGYVTPLVLACFGILFFFFFKYRRVLKFSWFAVLVVVVALGVKPERATRKTLKHFLPAESRYSLHNSLNSFSFYLIKEGATENIDVLVPHGFYKPYEISRTTDQTPRLIILIMGESMAAAQMHLLGAEAPTTPKLDSLKTDPNFKAFPAISGAVSTHTALPIFFNVMREPGNLAPIKDKTANLFRLAKQAGYTTHFLSAQDAKQTHEIGLHFIDDVVTIENAHEEFWSKKEDYLIELLKKRDLKNGKHFVVLNFRTLHSPYEKNYAHRKAEFSVFPTTSEDRLTRLKNSYYNAMLYTDQVVFDLITLFKEASDGDGVFILTADHGQLLGINGLFGHNILRPETAEVPFLIYADSLPSLKHKVWTHYEIGKMVVSFLGYKLTNPNEEAESFYIHGNNLYEEYDFLKLQRKPDETIVQTKHSFIRTYIGEKIMQGAKK